MKKFKLKKEKKNSILGIVLAVILLFSFNYSPISLLSMSIANNKKSSAYSSSTSQTYYGDDSVKQESGVNAGLYADGTSDYFTGSTNNYNILKNYTERYNKLFNEYIDEYLSALDKDSTSKYYGIYSLYLDFINQKSISSYYEANSSASLSSYSSFREYFEYFVTNSITWTDSDNNEHTLPVLFDQESGEGHKSKIYNSVANFLENNQVAIEGNDGINDNNDEFYEVSVSFKRVKSFIDNKISETTVITNYDGKTQDDYIAAIIANKAPKVQGYYFDSNAYETITTTDFSYKKETYQSDGNTTFSKPKVYYFGNDADLSSIGNAYINFINSGYKVDTSYGISELETNTLYYRPIQKGEFGYFDESHPTYYAYEKIPYDLTNSIYNLYVVDDSVTADEKASYDSLYYVSVITSDEINADRKNITNNDGTVDTSGLFYVQVPYFVNSNYADVYFKKLFSSISTNDYERIVSLFTDENKNSLIYFKISSSSYTSTKKVVYFDSTKSSYEDFLNNNPNYSYDVKIIELDDISVNADGLTMKDFEEISSDNSAYVKDYPLYFKKTRTYFETTANTYENYETQSNPAVNYEQTTVASKDYEKGADKDFIKYVLVENLEIDSVKYPTISKDVMNNNSALYSEVTDKELNSNYKFYYKHTTDSDGKINIDSFETLNNEKVIYVYNENVTINEVNYVAISNASFEIIRNLYVTAPSSVTSSINGENNSYSVYYKHTTEVVNQIYIIDDGENASSNEVYKNLNYKVLSSTSYKETYYNYVAVETTDANYNKNFNLYYKFANNYTDEDNYISNSSVFVQNKITGKNAIYIVDDSLSSTDKASYRSLYYTTITTSEFNAEQDFYVLINENDSNYSNTYTKLYYKYANTSSTEKKVYIYSKDASSIYQSFYTTDDNYNANDYELIEPNDPNYVAGLELYYKKKVTGTTATRYNQNSYYYFKTSSSVELKANSYYNISFYAYTNGNYYDENNELKTNDIFASFYIKDNDQVISDISIENISTDGKWVQYNAFIATDAISASKIYMYMYLGTEDNIAGKSDASEVSGTVLFDNIKITLIGETDYINKSIDANPVQQVIKEYDKEVVELPIVTQADIDEIDNRYEEITDLQIASDKLLDDNFYYYYKHLVDENNNVLSDYETNNNERVIYVFKSTNDSSATTISIDVITKTYTYENVDSYKNAVIIVDETMIGENEKLNNRLTNGSIISTWNEDFNLDASSTLSNRLNSLVFAGTEDGFTYHNDWHYYISRENSGQGNYEILKAYRQAYIDGKVTVSTIKESEIDKTVKDDDKDDDSSEEKEDSKDVATIPSTFNSDNNVIKIENKDRLKSLGIASNTFTIRQNEYYKITVWIYSPDKDSSATIKLESILQTAGTTNQGSLISADASNVKACLSEYSKAPTNEYSWIPVSFYVEGNAYHNQDINLVLLADADSVVYFDNITIEKVNSTNYDSVNTDSDDLTVCMTLSPTNSVVTKGITNGYFNLMTLTSDYVNVDYTTPKSAESWTVTSDSSSKVIAGVVPTSSDYIKNSTVSGVTNNFFTKYNNGEYVSTNGFEGNLYAIYAPNKAKATIHGEDGKDYSTTSNYSIYSSSTSLSATTMYEMSFEFYAGYNFSGNMIANLYSSSVADANILTSISISSDKLNDGWNKFTFYIYGGSASTSVYLELGVENAVGTCFFQKATNSTSSYSSISEARDSVINMDENVENSTNTVYDYNSLANYRFIDLADTNLSIFPAEKDDNGLFNSSNYTSSNINTSGYTVGETGTVVANYYTSSSSTYYTVTIKDVKFLKQNSDGTYTSETDADDTFYIKEIVSTNEDTSETTTTYKLYSDSMFTIEVVGFDSNSNKKLDDSELGNFTITKTSSTVKVTIDETDSTATAVTKTDYKYNFTKDVELNNQVISASELNNNYSQNVLILSNGYTTDYTLISPRIVGNVSKSSYYILKIYVKTSDITPYNSDKDSGLNIDIDSVTVNWNNINTTKSKNADENGFVCYELWLKTNTSSFDKFKVTFSLGSEKSPCSGYAIIAGISLEKMSSETLFNEYCDANEKLYTENDDNSIAKRYYGVEETKKDDSTDDDDDDSSIWATFFYIFSSLLLGIVLIIALVAIFIKNHPIKSKKKVEDDIIVVNPKEIDSKQKEKEEKKKLKEKEKNNPPLDTVKDDDKNESENTSALDIDENTETEETTENTTNGDEGFL